MKYVVFKDRSMPSPTWTNDPGVFTVATVVLPKRSVCTLQDGGLPTGTLHVVQPNLILPLSKERHFFGLKNRPAVCFSTHNLCIGDTPLIVTHRSPAVPVEDLHSARATWGSSQTDFNTFWRLKTSSCQCGSSVTRMWTLNVSTKPARTDWPVSRKRLRRPIRETNDTTQNLRPEIHSYLQQYFPKQAKASVLQLMYFCIYFLPSYCQILCQFENARIFLLFL